MSYLWAYIMGDTTIVFNIFFNVQNLDSMMLNAKYDCVLFFVMFDYFWGETTANVFKCHLFYS